MARRRTKPGPVELTKEQRRYLEQPLTFLCFGFPSECEEWQDVAFDGDEEVLRAYRQHREKIPARHPLHELAGNPEGTDRWR